MSQPATLRLRRCPQCRTRTVHIIYGEPSPDLAEEARAGKVVLAGCVIGDEASTPTRACLGCGWEGRARRVGPKRLGPVYTKGYSYRARAEERQREYQAGELKVAHGRYGHLLDASAASAGRNFVLPEACEAARARQHGGKGVALRTFENMLSSQAMCFNIFAPLSSRMDLAAEVLRPFVPGLATVTAVVIEDVPAADVFNDQSGLGGVGCDLLVEGTNHRGEGLLLVVETKFVEPEFSACGFTKSGRAKKGQAVCPTEVAVRGDREQCLYTRNNGYAYWRRTDKHELLSDEALEPSGCAFSGSKWQLWVNLGLAHEEAKRRGATDCRFAVCTAAKNTVLLKNGTVLSGFSALLRRPQPALLIELDALLVRIEEVAPVELRTWAEQLSERYAHI